MRKREARTLMLFCALALGCTLATDIVGIFIGSQELMELAVLWPMIFALAFTLIPSERRENWHQLGMDRLGDWRWYALAFLLPTVSVALGFLIARLLRLVDVPRCGQVLCPEPTTGSDAFSFITGTPLLYAPILMIFAWVEEVAWRGYLQPQAQRVLGLKGALLLTGLVWACWHFGLFIWAGYYPGGILWLDMLMFTVDLVLESIVMGWIRVRGGSLWPLVLYHGTSNIAWMLCDRYFQIKHPGWVYIAGESGIPILIFWGIAALLVWRQIDREASREARQAVASG